ncbi:hypothetical protein LAZ67_10003549 [Cordylochernes scorpioides]|uniref:Transposase n=2 Tax=Cordylochernes scorpioides TaxID=51811 RepID=A0ABY6KX63_9ARAC|nr:hypothetical protein LAZ67_10003549 [Cordylochernes scorpioides]
MVRQWRSWFSEGRQNVHDDEQSGRPVTATDNAAVAAVRNVVEADRRVTIDEIMIRLPPGIEIGRSSIGTIMSDVLNFRKVCARWVPRLLSENHKQQRMEAARAFLEMHRRDGDQLFSHIVTGDESWVHHSTPETKRQSMVWKKPEESAPKKAKVTISAGKVMSIVFWDCKGVLLVDYLPPNTTVNAARYCKVLTKLRAAIKRKRPGLLSRKVLLVHDNARPHAARTTQTLLENFKWEIFTHPPYSLDLAPSDFHLFPALKLHLGGKHFENDDEVQAEANHWLRRQDTAWYNSGIKNCYNELTATWCVSKWQIGESPSDMTSSCETSRITLTNKQPRTNSSIVRKRRKTSLKILSSTDPVDRPQQGFLSRDIEELRLQSQTFTKMCLDHGGMINESCTPIPHSREITHEIRFHRRVKAKTSLQDDDVPIDDTTTKPLFTWQEKECKATTTSMESLAEAHQIHVKNPRATLLELEQDTGISKTTIGRIVTEDLRLKKTPAKFIPRFLTNEQKLCRLATCEDMLEMTRTDPEWKDKIITGDETWVYGYDPETKRQSAEWRGQDIAPNDFFLFPKLKAVLKGRHFDTREDIIEKSLLALKSIPKEAYKNCFDNWEKRWRWMRPEEESCTEPFITGDDEGTGLTTESEQRNAA